MGDHERQPDQVSHMRVLGHEKRQQPVPGNFLEPVWFCLFLWKNISTLKQLITKRSVLLQNG